MQFTVLLTEDAAADLQELYAHIARHDSVSRAEYVLDQIEKKFTSLSELPERRVCPKELQALGIREYREIFFKPYRILYRIYDKIDYVYLITDGRRDMQTLLQRRLLSVLEMAELNKTGNLIASLLYCCFRSTQQPGSN